MEYTDKEYCLEVWGDYACFTRPELKVERVSYDVITPSAARAIFEAIDRAEGAVLIHCFSGKDRTGMVAALLLDLAGVDGADIVADYQVSLTYLTGPEAHRIPSNPENMAAYLALLGQYGGAAQFLSQRCGLPSDLIARIRSRLCR